MPLKMPKVVFDVPILVGGPEKAQIISNALTRIGKRFKARTKATMEAGPATGRLYARRGASGFRRSHRASARGERPAPDTGNLVRSTVDRKVSSTEHEVFVDDSRAPYGGILEGPALGRVIMSEEDVQAFVDGEMVEELERVHEELTRSRG